MSLKGLKDFWWQSPLKEEPLLVNNEEGNKAFCIAFIIALILVVIFIVIEKIFLK